MIKPTTAPPQPFDQHRRFITSGITSGIVCLCAAASLLAGCGSDDNKSSASTPATTAGTPSGDSQEPAESYQIVSDAVVATGYGEMLALMATLSVDPGSADADALEEVHEKWETFEGTVKQNDPDSYLASEEALDSFLEAGADADGAAMTAATTKMSTTAATYLAAYPG